MTYEKLFMIIVFIAFCHWLAWMMHGGKIKRAISNGISRLRYRLGRKKRELHRKLVMYGRMQEMCSSGPHGRRLATILHESGSLDFHLSPGPEWYSMSLEERYKFQADLLEGIKNGSIETMPMKFEDGHKSVEGSVSFETVVEANKPVTRKIVFDKDAPTLKMPMVRKKGGGKYADMKRPSKKRK